MMGIRSTRTYRRIVGVATVALMLLIGGCVSTRDKSDQPDKPHESDESIVTPETTAAPSTELEAAEKYSNTLRWTTASEVDNFGFDVYRSTSEDGPFERITVDLIPGAGTIDEPQKYIYVDDTIDPTKGYFYYVESISMSSVRERFSPVISIGPKKPAPPE